MALNAVMRQYPTVIMWITWWTGICTILMATIVTTMGR